MPNPSAVVFSLAPSTTRPADEADGEPGADAPNPWCRVMNSKNLPLRCLPLAARPYSGLLGGGGTQV